MNSCTPNTNTQVGVPAAALKKLYLSNVVSVEQHHFKAKANSGGFAWLNWLEKENKPTPFVVAYRWKTENGEIACSKWLPPEVWQRERKVEPNYRSVLATELVWETDYEKPETNLEVFKKGIAPRLKEFGISYKAYFTGAKSIHVHSLFAQLKELEPRQRTKAKEALTKLVFEKGALYRDLDEANFKPTRLIQIEDATNPKTEKPKTLVDSFGDWRNNMVPPVVLKAAQKEPKTLVHDAPKFVPGKCLFLDWACENKLPEGQRNQVVAPNLMAVCPGKAEQFASTQGMLLSHVTGWQNTEFNCKQLQEYAGSVDKRSICDLCLLEEKKNG